jgi:hypothetical protein
MNEERFVDYVRARLFLFHDIRPMDDRSRAVLFARDNELRQLIQAMGIEALFIEPPPIQYKPEVY